MHNHEPEGYECPFCQFLAGKETEFNSSSDIVRQNDLVSAFVGPISWEKNPGSILVVPNKHYENIYSIPGDAFAAVYELVKQTSVAMRATYECSGITIIQRNEPNAGQHVWHLHVHIIPRYPDDDFQENDQTLFVDTPTRAPYAEKLRNYLQASA